MSSAGLVANYTLHPWKRNSSSVLQDLQIIYKLHSPGIWQPKKCSGSTNFFFNLKTAVFSGQLKHKPQNHKAAQTLQLVFSLQHNKWGLLFLHTREISTTEMKCTLTANWGASCILISQLPGRSSHHYSDTWEHTLMAANIYLGKAAEMLPPGMISTT